MFLKYPLRLAAVCFGLAIGIVIAHLLPGCADACADKVYVMEGGATCSVKMQRGGQVAYTHCSDDKDYLNATNVKVSCK